LAAFKSAASNGAGVGGGGGAAATGGGCAGVPDWASAAPTVRPKQRIQRDSPREPRAKFIDVSSWEKKRAVFFATIFDRGR